MHSVRWRRLWLVCAIVRGDKPADMLPLDPRTPTKVRATTLSSFYQSTPWATEAPSVVSSRGLILVSPPHTPGVRERGRTGERSDPLSSAWSHHDRVLPLRSRNKGLEVGGCVKAIANEQLESRRPVLIARDCLPSIRHERHRSPAIASAISLNRCVQSWPRRVSSRTPRVSRHATRRKPSYLIS